MPPRPSGGMFKSQSRPKAAPMPTLQQAYRQNRFFYWRIAVRWRWNMFRNPISEPEVDERTIVMSACGEQESAPDLSLNGAFTLSLLNIWDEGGFNGDYFSFMNVVARDVIDYSDQVPRIHGIEFAQGFGAE